MAKREDNKVKKHSPLRRVFDIFLMITSIGFGIALLLTLIAPYVSPQSVGLLPTLALFAPATFLVNLILMLYWLATWRWQYAVALLILLLCSVGHISLFMNYSATQEYGEPSYKGMTKVLSYNVRTLFDDNGEVSSERIGKYLNKSSADIITLQEFYGGNSRKVGRFMPNIAKYNVVENGDLRIFTRYPIISSCNPFKKYGFEGGRSLCADLVVGKDTLRVVTAHLQSTSIKISDSDYLTSKKVVTDNNRHQKVINIIRRYQLSCIARAEQARALSTFIKESPYPIIVTGDFNDTPASYAYNRISRGLKDSFKECGEGYSYTFRGFFNMLRIDYILMSDRVSAHSYEVDHTFTVSDHLPVTSHIKIEKRSK